MEYKLVHVPMISTDRLSIERCRSSAKRKFKQWKKTEFVPSQLIKDKKYGDFYTYPEILVHL